MGEGLFVHASNSLVVISIACSIIVPFEERKKQKSFENQKGEGLRTLIPPILTLLFFCCWRFKSKLTPGSLFFFITHI